MINIYYRAVKETGLKMFDNFKTGSWIDVCEPSDGELDKLVEMLKVERDLLTDALDQFEVPRLESENGITYLFTRVPESNGGGIITVPLLFVIGNNFVMTLSWKKLSLLDDFISGKRCCFTTQKTKFFLEVFAEINRVFGHYINDVNKRLRSIEIRIDKISNKEIIQFVNYERVLNDFISALVPTNAVLKKLLDGRHIPLYEEDKDLVEDLFLNTGELVELSGATIKHAVNIRDAYSQIMNQELNQVMKILTSLTVVLTVPTMIFSFYGMNINLPQAETPLFYIAVALGAFTVSFLLYFIFLRSRWLK